MLGKIERLRLCQSSLLVLHEVLLVDQPLQVPGWLVRGRPEYLDEKVDG